MEPKRAKRGGGARQNERPGESTTGSHAIVLVKWVITYQDRGLSLCASFMGRPRFVLVRSKTI